MRCILQVVLGLLIFSLAGETCQARSLHWQKMAVEATLDRDGRLHIREMQTMVFTGDWNGGERTFAVRSGQDLSLARITRVDSVTGQEQLLREGNLSRVDDWAWHGAQTLRWRSRLPSDPLFSNTALTYVLEYVLSGILLPAEEGYRLHHDFSFPERSGPIRHFTLTLNLDPVWNVQGTLPRQMERTDIPPGQGVVLDAVLIHTTGTPASIGRLETGKQQERKVSRQPQAIASSWLSMFLLAVLWPFFLWRVILFWRHEKKNKRFEPLIPVSEINSDWLKDHVFCHPPELVGATWDKTTSASEVAAVLARLVTEDKMASRVTPKRFPFLGFIIPGMATLHLTLLVRRDKFSGYERKLIDGLFIDGDTTDTDRIKKYYRSRQTSFDPVAKIRGPLQKQVKRLTAQANNPLAWIWVPTVLCLVTAFFVLFFNAFFHQHELGKQMWGIGILCGGWLFSVIMAVVGYSHRSDRLTARAAGVVAAGGFLCLLFSIMMFSEASSLLLIGLFLLCTAAVNNIYNVAKTRDSEEGIRLRRYLASGRAFLKEELMRDTPNLKDSWFPYLMAFGLGSNVDRWFRRYSSTRGTTAVFGSSGSDGSAVFTGGGGRFGGAGAGGSWSAAAGSLAASVSTSSSGGGGSSGGSSGGGGGGGW